VADGIPIYRASQVDIKKLEKAELKIKVCTHYYVSVPLILDNELYGLF